MLGTILIVILILASLVRCHDGRIAETGGITQAAEWG